MAADWDIVGEEALSGASPAMSPGGGEWDVLEESRTEPSWTERVLSKIKVTGSETYRGAQQGFAGMGRQLGVAIEATSQPGSYLHGLGGSMREVWGDVEDATRRPDEVSALPWYDPARIAGATGQGAMSMIPGLGAGAAAAAVGAPVVVGAGIGGVVAGYQEAEALYRQRLAEGIPEEQAFQEALKAFPAIAALNALPFARILGRTPGRLKTGIAEAVTEIAEEPVQAVITDKDPLAATIEGAKEVGPAAFLMGAALGGGSQPAPSALPTMERLRRAYPEPTAPQEPRRLPAPADWTVDSEEVIARPGQERPARRLVEGPQPSDVMAVDPAGNAAPLTETEADQAAKARAAERERRQQLGEQQLGRRAVPEAALPVEAPAQPQGTTATDAQNFQPGANFRAPDVAPTEQGRAPEPAAASVLPASGPDSGVRPDPFEAPAPAPRNAREEFQHARWKAVDPRLTRDVFRRALITEAEKLVPGGGVSYLTDPHGRITGRTSSQNPPWVQDLLASNGVSVKWVQAAVRKATAGEQKLGAREVRVVKQLLDAVSIDRTDGKDFRALRRQLEAERPRFTPSADELAAEGGLEQDGIDGQLVAQARDLDEGFVERAAIQHGDDAAFMAAIRGFLDEQGTNRPADAYSAPGQREGESGAAGRGRVSEPGGVSGYEDVQRGPGRDAGAGRGAESWSQATRIKGRSGRPARVYRGARVPLAAEHFRPEALGRASGHPSSAIGVWFSADRADAAGYGSVEAFHLDIRNPLIVKFENLPALETAGEWARWREQLRARGHDGIIIDGRSIGGPTQFVAFDPAQVHAALAPSAVSEPQSDLFAHGRDAESLERRNALEAERRRRDARRNTGQTTIETGRADDLFSQARAQADLVDETAQADRNDLPDDRGAVRDRRRTAAPGDLAAAAPIQLDIFAAPSVAHQATRKAARLENRVELRTVGAFKSNGVERVDDWTDAARIVEPLREEPQEQFLAVVIDDSGKPLAVIRHTMGTIDQSLVEPWSLAGAILSIPGAARVYFAHNHPSGRMQPSQADEQIHAKLADVLTGTGVEVVGGIILRPNSRDATYFPIERLFPSSTSTNAGVMVRGIVAGTKGGSRGAQDVPVQQRRFARFRADDAELVRSPISARRVVDQTGEESGVLLLDNQNTLVGVVPMDAAEMAKLRTGRGGGADRLLQSVAEANALAAITFGADRDALVNVNGLLAGADVRVLDTLVGAPGGWSNLSETEGTPPIIPLSQVNSTPLGPIYDAYRRAAGRWLATWNRKVGWRWDVLGQLPQRGEYLIRRYLALGDVKKGERIGRGIYDALAKADATDQQEVYDYLTTRGAQPNMIRDAAIRAKAVEVKQLIDAIGQRLVSSGLLSPQAYAAHADEYLPRLYLKHLLGEENYRALGSGKRLSDLGYLKKRKDIPPDVRKVILGEITDPAFLASFSVTRTLRDLALVDFLNDVSANRRWVPPGATVSWAGRQVTPFWLRAEARKLHERAALYADPQAKQQVEAMATAMEQAAAQALQQLGVMDRDGHKQIPDSPKYGGLRGLWVRKEIFNDLVGAQQWIEPDASWAEAVLGPGGALTTFTQWWKLSKVALNPPSQLRNFVSNAMLVHLSGVPLHLIPMRYAQALKALRERSRYFQIADKYGLFATTFSNVELRRIETEWLDLQRKATGGGTAATLKLMGGHLANFAGDAYALNEALGKIAKLIDGMEREGKGEAEAMLEAHEWLFDYSLVPRSVQYLRNAPLGAPFLTFYYKVIPKIGRVALTDPLKFAPYLAVGYALQEAIKNAYDVDDDDLEQLRAALPLWMRERGHAYLLPWKDANGRWQVLDMGYIVPWGMFADVAAQASQGEGVKALETVGVLSGPIPDIISAIKTNVDPFTGRKVIDPSDPAHLQLATLLGYVWNIAAPPFISTQGGIKKLYDALTGRVDPRSGEQKLTPAQAAGRLLGVSLYPVDPVESRQQNLRAMKREIEDIRSRLASKLRDKNLTDADRADVRRVYGALIRERMQALQDYAQDTQLNPRLLREPAESQEPIA